MIIITGGTGFIGSNLVNFFSNDLSKDIAIVDDLSDGKKFTNVIGSNVIEYFDKDVFLDLIGKDDAHFKNVEAVFHMGACTDTTEWNGKIMMNANFSYSRALFVWATSRKIPLIYASSAAVYGNGANGFKEEQSAENPLNVYGFSKLVFDNFVRYYIKKNYLKSPVFGLRFFNVFGLGEEHKGSMASTIFHFNRQIQDRGVCNLFEGTNGIGNGLQSRDFVYVKDIIKVISWAYNQHKTGVFNCGSGVSRSFKDVANTVIKWNRDKKNIQGKICYIPFPSHLLGSYQNYTKAELNSLREAGYEKQFVSLEEGITDYLNCMENKNGVN